MTGRFLMSKDKAIPHIAIFSIVLMANVLFFLFVADFLPIRYEENDDALMCMIANGVLGGRPDCHLVFINSILGHFLSWLYSISSNIEWYACFLSVLHIISVSAISYLVLMSDKKWIIKAGFAIVIYVLWFYIIGRFQFTTTAGIVTIAGISLMFSEMLGGARAVTGLVLVFIGSLVRFQAAGLVLLLLSPLIILRMIENRGKLIPVVLMLLSIILGRMIDKMDYQSEDWAQYSAYNSVRGHINDNPQWFRGLKYLPDTVSEEDYYNLMWANTDVNIMDINVLGDILHNIYNELWHKPWRIFKNYMPLRQYLIPCCLVLFLLLNASLSCKKMGDKTNKKVLFTAIILFIGVVLGINFTATLKKRVFLCILFAILYIVFEYSSKVKCYILALSLILFATLYVRHDVKIINEEKEQFPIEALTEIVADDDFYFSTFWPDVVSPFKVHTFPKRPLYLGWLAGISLAPELVDGHLSFLENSIPIVGENDGFCKVIQRSLMRNYGIAADIVLLDSIDGINKYKLVQSKDK